MDLPAPVPDQPDLSSCSGLRGSPPTMTVSSPPFSTQPAAKRLLSPPTLPASARIPHDERLGQKRQHPNWHLHPPSESSLVRGSSSSRAAQRAVRSLYPPGGYLVGSGQPLRSIVLRNLQFGVGAAERWARVRRRALRRQDSGSSRSKHKGQGGQAGQHAAAPVMLSRVVMRGPAQGPSLGAGTRS